MSIVQDYVHKYIEDHVTIGPAFTDVSGAPGLFETHYASLVDILKEGSYLFYEFRDIEKEYEVDGEHPEYGTYVKYISPLYADSIVSDRDNQELLEIITEELPYYHKGFEGDAADPEYLISRTRDAGINDVPSFLQTDFWAHWFRDVQGYIQNYVLLDVFNKLRYPFINENQYLNADLFPELAQKAYNPSNDGGEGVTWTFLMNLPSASVGDVWKISSVEGAPESAIAAGIQEGTFVICHSTVLYKIDPNEWYDYWRVYKEGSSLIEFKTTILENAQDEADPNSVGCLDYLDDVVDQKLDSIYSLIDYNPDQSRLLADWGDSAYESGKITSDELEKEKTIFKLQDIRYELLRRKFAGSSTLYSLALSSIGRQGSFASIIRVGDLATASASFKDTRFLRILNIPGILSQFADLTDLDPINTYYTAPLEKEEIPMNLGIVSPLFYTSAETSEGAYNAERFYDYNGDNNKVTTQKEYRNAFLRDNSTTIEWDNPPGIISSSSINTTWRRFDEKIVNPEAPTQLIYRKLDSDYYPEEGSDEHYPLRLDISTPIYKVTSVMGNVLDISADRLLYHRNTLQKELSSLYPYLTYSIADNNSVSLMDLSWISYLKSTTERKSRVQDEIVFGAQVSNYQALPSIQLTEHIFFGLTYGTEDRDYSAYYDWDEASSIYAKTQDTSIVPGKIYYEYISSHYVPVEIPVASNLNIYYEYIGRRTPKFAFLWYCEVKYNSDTFDVVDVATTLISKITLRVSADARFENVDTFGALERNSMGVIPFTYSNLINDTVAGLRLGVYTDNISETESETKFFDDLADLGYSKAVYLFSDYDILAKSPLLSGTPEAATLTQYFSQIPSIDTKSLLFVISRASNTDESVIEYHWSDPLRVVSLNIEFLNRLKASYFKPDWYKMSYHLNPYLNFTSESASALRHVDVIPAYLYTYLSDTEEGREILNGPSEYCGLSNLCRKRHMDFVCNDNGEAAPTAWVTDWLVKHDNQAARNVYGLFLKRFRPTDPAGFITSTPEWVVIKGDNRYADVYDESSERYSSATYSPQREIIYRDDVLPIPSINFSKGTATSTDTQIAANYFQILPCDTPDTTAWSHWYWNELSDGFAACLNIKLDTTNCLTTLLNEGNIRLLYRENEFSLDIVKETIVVEGDTRITASIVFTYYPAGDSITAWTVSSSNIMSGNTLRDINYRIAIGTSIEETASNNTVTLTLIVNNEVFHSSNSTAGLTIQGTLPSEFILGSPVRVRNNTASTAPIELFSKATPATSSSPVLQENSFFGDVYDLRLYNVGISPEQLFILSTGILRESYSYAASLYKLGYSLYRDLGILKTVTKRSIWPSDLPNIAAIRVFNRSVWDSILVDMYRISEEEKTGTSPQYIKSWADPIDDTDIYNEEGDLSDCILQPLEDSVEVYNGISPLSSNNKACSLRYDSELINIAEEDRMSIVMTSLYPVSYNDQKFISHATLKWDDEKGTLSTDASIAVPISPEASTFKYSADIGLNFTAKPSFDLSNWYSRGTNISLIYNEDLKRSVAALTNTAIRDSQQNHILIPLRIPKQRNLPSLAKGSFDRFILKGVQLNPGITTFLRATSYYNELRVPIAKQKSLTEMPSYVSKWDAIRVLKEGTYYFTCKYPVQLLPFMDYLYNTSADSRYSTVYASIRFKIEVSGNPIPYDNDKYTIVGYPKKYLSDNLEGTLRTNQGLVIDDDNRTFPHRELNIDFYVMDVQGIAGVVSEDTGEESYTFTWRPIGSNHPEDFEYVKCESGERCVADVTYYKYVDGEYTVKTGLTPGDLVEDYYKKTGLSLIRLDRDRLKTSLVLSDSIPAFFSKNYTSPFFIAKTTKTTEGVTYDSTSADDDLINPYDIQSDYSQSNLAKEKLTAASLDDLDKQCIIAGRSYKLLFDYNGRVSEISFTDNTFTPVLDTWSKEGYYTMSNSEKQGFSRLTNLLDTTTASTTDYMYRGNSNWFSTKDFNVKGKTSGFGIDSQGTWKNPNSSLATPVATLNGDILTISTTDDRIEEYEIYEGDELLGITATSVPNGNFYFGNPYSRSSNQNYLLQTNPSDRVNLDNSLTFPYIPEDVPQDTYVSGAYVSRLDAVSSKSASLNVYTLKTELISEIDVIESQWDRISGTVSSALSSLRGDASGLLTSVSEIAPNFTFSTPTGSAEADDLDYINYGGYELYGYKASGRSLVSKDASIVITRRGLYSNNLLQNQNFTDMSSWFSSQTGYYEADDDWDHGNGKDVFRYDLRVDENNHGIPVTLKYITGSKIIGAKYEAAISIRSDVIEQIDAEDTEIRNLIKEYSSASTSEERRAEILAELEADYGYASIQEAIIGLETREAHKFDSLTVQALYIVSNGSVETVVATTTLTASQKSQKDEQHSWYVYDAETADVVTADRVAFRFVSTVPQTIRITKAVIRKSDSTTQYLGLANALYATGASADTSKVEIVGHSVVLYKDVVTGEVLPIQFLNAIKTRALNAGVSAKYAESGQKKSSEFIHAYSLGYVEKGSRLEKLFEPWVRRMTYWRTYKKGTELEENNKVVFYKYEVGTDYTGAKSRTIVPSCIEDMYTTSTPTSIVYNSGRATLDLDISPNNSLSNIASIYNTCLSINLDAPAVVSEETLSGISNCFNTTRYQQGLSTPVAITNMQLMSELIDNKRDILYELEYLPIIYDEKDQHISLNLFLHRKASE